MPSNFDLEIREFEKKNKAPLLKTLRLWYPYNVHLLTQNSENYKDNDSLLTYHYKGREQNGEKVSVMLSIRLKKGIIAASDYEFIPDDKIEVKSYNDPMKKIGSTAKVKKSAQDQKNTFGKLCRIRLKPNNKVPFKEEK